MTINKTDKETYTNAKIQIDGESNNPLVEKQRRSLRDSMAKVKSKQKQAIEPILLKYYWKDLIFIILSM